MKRLKYMGKLMSFIFCIFISTSLVSCGSGSPLKKIYNEVYPEYESIMSESQITIFTFKEGNDFNQNFSNLEVNFTGRVCVEYQNYDIGAWTKVTDILTDIKNHIGIDISYNEFCKANNGYYYGQLSLANKNICCDFLYESKNRSDMVKLRLNEQIK